MKGEQVLDANFRTGQKTNFKKGFTLLELLVVLVIVSLLSVMAVVRFRASQKVYALTSAKQTFVSVVRQAQLMATAGTEVPYYSGCSDVDLDGVCDSSGYGVYVASPTAYSLFFNDDDEVVNQYVPGSSIVIQTINLTSEITVNGVGNSVFFLPPQPVTYLNGGTSLELFDFTFTRAGVIQNVQVTKYGAINY